jgi:hypothetical protein
MYALTRMRGFSMPRDIAYCFWVMNDYYYWLWNHHWMVQQLPFLDALAVVPDRIMDKRSLVGS